MKIKDFNFFESKFLSFFVPSVFFIGMIIISLINRLIGDYGVETDFYVAYVLQAKEILNGNLLIDQYRGPLYQIILALFTVMLQVDFYTAGKILNVVCASITLLFIFNIIKLIINSEGAFYVVLLIAVNHCFIKYSYTPGTDMLFLLFYTSSLFFILKNENFNSRNFLIVGILISMTYLTRYTGISLIVFALIFYSFKIYKEYKKKEIAFRNRFIVRRSLYFVTPLLISILTWGGVCYFNTGQFFYNMNFKNTALTVYKPDDISKDEWISKFQSSFNSMSDVILKDIGLFFNKIFIQNFTTYFFKDVTRLFPKIIGILIIIGAIFFFIKIRSQSEKRIFFLISGIIFYFQILFIFYSERFSLPLLPLYSFFIISLFYYNFFDKIKLKFGKFNLLGLIIISLIIYNFVNSYKIISQDINEGPKEILTIKKWTKENYKGKLQNKKIMARKPHIAYYLDMNYFVTPFVKNYNEFIETLEKNNIDFYFINEKEADNFTDENIKIKLLNYASPPAELELISYTSNPISALYRVRK